METLELYLVLAISFTILGSAFCSLLEALILSTTSTEIEELKHRNPRRGMMLERFKEEMEETSSAILTLNTIANTSGTALVAAIATTLFADNLHWAIIPVGMTLAILFCSEVLPKNVGVAYRRLLQPYAVFPLSWVRRSMSPFSFFLKWSVKAIVRPLPSDQKDGDQEILLLAEKGAKDGMLTSHERDLIANALTLDDLSVGEIMTPRTVVTAFEKSMCIREVFEEFNNIRFARLPVYEENIDEIVGLVRRRDLLKAKAEGQNDLKVGEIMHKIIFIPETASASSALQIFLKNHQQLAVVVDEYGSMAGVVTMEDIVEHILGKEIFEKDDVAVDMRELARRQHAQTQIKNGTHK